MSVAITMSTSGRIVRQLRHDRRTVALLIAVPSLLLALLYFMYEDSARTFDRVALIMLGIFPFVIMFLVTSIAMLRERTTGTLERLLTTPLGKVDLLFGYGLAFSLAAAVQGAVATGVAYWLLGLDTLGSPALVVLIAVVNAVLGVALGLLCSAFARTEFQAVQFLPVVVVPTALLTLLYFMYDQAGNTFDRIALVMLGIFPFVIMFLVTSIAMLRERTTGTLERLLTTPLGKLDLLFGYGLAFGLAAAVQGGVTVAAAYGLLGLDTKGSTGLVVLIAVVNAVLGVALGLFCSAFARTEFQAVQFLPVVVVPQLLLCGLFVPREQMAGWLQAISDVMPLTYAVDALLEVGKSAEATATMWRDVTIVAGAAVLALILAAATLRRRTP